MPHSHRRSTHLTVRKVGNGHLHGYSRFRHRGRRDVKRANMKMGSRTSTDDCSKKSFFSTDVNIGIGGDRSKSMGLGRRMIAWYTTKLETHPYTTKCITSGMMAGLGNVTCQFLEQKGGTKDEKKNDHTNSNTNVHENANDPSSSVIIEWDRAARFFVMGFGFIAPAMHIWYGFIMRQIPGVTLSKVVQRTAFDQFFFTPLYIPVFMTTLRVLEEGPDLIMNDVKRKEMSEELCRDVPGVLVACWGVWIPATLINFRFVPGKLQVLYSNIVGFFWNIFLSWKLNRNGDDDADASEGQGNGYGHDNHDLDDHNLHKQQ